MKTGKRKVRDSGRFSPKMKPDAEKIEKASQQLAIWARANTPVSMGLYTGFFFFLIRGRLHQSVPSEPDTFDFTALDDVFRTTVFLSLAEALGFQALNADNTAILIHGDGCRMLIAEFHDKDALAKLLRSSGGRVN